MAISNEVSHLIRNQWSGLHPRTWCGEVNRRLEAERVEDCTCRDCLRTMADDYGLRKSLRSEAQDRLNQLDGQTISGMLDDMKHRLASANALPPGIMAVLGDRPVLSPGQASELAEQVSAGALDRLADARKRIAAGHDLAGSLVDACKALVAQSAADEFPQGYDVAPEDIKPPRCDYIPPDGKAEIARVQERGGTTPGDIQALRDRYGCKALATHEVERWSDDDSSVDHPLVNACIDHVGHMLSGDGCWVAPVGYDAPAESQEMAEKPQCPHIAHRRPDLGIPCAYTDCRSVRPEGATMASCRRSGRS